MDDKTKGSKKKKKYDVTKANSMHLKEELAEENSTWEKRGNGERER